MSHIISQVIAHGTAVKEFHLRRQDGTDLPGWAPGAHIAVRLKGAGGSVFNRHYSLVGAAGPAHTYRIAVLREQAGKGGSRALHDEFGIGSLIDIGSPVDSFPLHTGNGPKTVLVAGGIGITPLVSMAHALSARGEPFELHYLVRSADRLVLLDELRALPHGSIRAHVSEESGPADLLALLGTHQEGVQLYACGPSVLLQALATAAADACWPASALHFESFGARAQASDGPLSVTMGRSEMTVEVAPGSSILDALLAADAFVSYECKRGECGKCYTPVLAGTPLHRDICLTPAMRATGMCICVSWAASGQLVLEL